MSEAETVLDGQGDEPVGIPASTLVAPPWTDSRAMPDSLLRMGLPDAGLETSEPAALPEQAPVKQARSLLPRYRVMVQLTRVDDDHDQPDAVAHWLPGHYRKPESADIDASAVYEEDYLTMHGVIGHVAVVECVPGEAPRLYSVRHFPEE